MTGPYVSFNNQSPDQVFEWLLMMIDEPAEDLAQLVPVPSANSYISFTWQYVVMDNSKPSGTRGYGVSDGRLIDRGDTIQLYANMGDFREMPLSEVLDSIAYPVTAVNLETRTPNTYGAFDYANPAYVETHLNGELPAPRS